jgi:protein transport protein SEC24
MADYAEGESEIPTANADAEGPFRCGKCGGYINPGFSFVEGGAAMLCNLCGNINPVGNSIYSYNNDKSSLPEMDCGAYEFEVGGRYVYQTARQPTYVFLVDTTIESLSTGVFDSMLLSIK